MAIMTKSNMDTTKFFIALLVGFVVIQIGSYFLSELGFMPFIKMGWGIMLMLVVVLITTLFVMGKNLTQLNLKRDGPFILLIFVTIILMFVFLPDIIPQIFSTAALEMKDSVQELIATISRLGPGGIIR